MVSDERQHIKHCPLEGGCSRFWYLSVGWEITAPNPQVTARSGLFNERWAWKWGFSLVQIDLAAAVLISAPDNGACGLLHSQACRGFEERQSKVRCVMCDAWAHAPPRKAELVV